MTLPVTPMRSAMLDREATANAVPGTGANIAATPLVPGSVTARLLYDIWSDQNGYWQGDDLPTDAVMPVIFEHLHLRADFRITIHAEVDRAAELLGPKLSHKAQSRSWSGPAASTLRADFGANTTILWWRESSDSHSIQTFGFNSVDIPLDVILAGAR